MGVFISKLIMKFIHIFLLKQIKHIYFILHVYICVYSIWKQKAYIYIKMVVYFKQISISSHISR